MIKGIVAMHKMVETTTRRLTYAASQSYFSANIVALEAAGVAAIMITTSCTTVGMFNPQSTVSLTIAITTSGNRIWRKDKNQYMCLSVNAPFHLISAKRKPITTIESGATKPLSIERQSQTKPISNV